MAGELRFVAKYDGGNSKTCTIWITEGGQDITERLSGVMILDVRRFFARHQSLMPGQEPDDFALAVRNDPSESAVSVPVVDDIGAFRELGFKFQDGSRIDGDLMTSRRAGTEDEFRDALYRPGDTVRMKSTSEEGQITCVIRKIDGMTFEYEVLTQGGKLTWDEVEVEMVRIGG